MIYKNTIKNWGQRILKILLFLILVYLIYNQILNSINWTEQLNEVLDKISNSSPFLIFLILVFSFFNWSLDALRWKILLAHIYKISFFQSIKAVFSGLSIAIVTPNKIGDFLGRIIHLPAHKKTSGALSTFVGSFSQLAITYFLGIIGLLYFIYNFSAWWAYYLLFGGGILFTLFLYLYFNLSKFRKYEDKFRNIRLLKVLLWTFGRYDKLQLTQALLLSFIRIIIYNIQFIILAYIFGVELILLDALFLSFLMFWLISLIPSFFLADIGVRAYVSQLIFVQSGLITQDLAIMTASLVIWLLNVILPALFGLPFIGQKVLLGNKKDKK